MARVLDFGARTRRTHFIQLGAVIVLVLAVACSGGDGSTPPDTSIQAAISEGNGSSLIAGQQVSTRPAVKVTSSGAARSGVSVTFAVTSGGGTAHGLTQTTDANGIARVGGWLIGYTAGANTMSATVTGVTTPLVFTVRGIAGPATTVSAAGGDAQTAMVGTPVAIRPSVLVTDDNANPVQGVTVTFTALLGSTVTAPNATTGADGVATVGGWTLATTAGGQSLEATVAGVSQVSFSATSIAGPPAQLTKVAGDGQTGAAGTTLPISPSVRVADQFGNLLRGMVVSFSTTTASGTTSVLVTTSAQGVATLPFWTLSTTVGPQTLTATVNGVATPLVFTATVTPGPAALLTKQGGDAQTAAAGTITLNKN